MKNLMKWRKWILGAALVLACVESVVLWNGRDKYLRYVSPPLPDGTRYTFLYAAQLSIITHMPSDGSDISFAITDPRSAIFFQAASSPQCTDINIQVGGKNSGTYGDGRDDKKDLYSHFRHIRQMHSLNQFFLWHRSCDNEEQPFEREDEVFNKSFQILPPGSPVPSP